MGGPHPGQVCRGRAQSAYEEEESNVLLFNYIRT
jgi:hypothetical protein